MTQGRWQYHTVATKLSKLYANFSPKSVNGMQMVMGKPFTRFLALACEAKDMIKNLHNRRFARMGPTRTYEERHSVECDPIVT